MSWDRSMKVELHHASGKGPNEIAQWQELQPWPSGIHFEDSPRAARPEPFKQYHRAVAHSWSSLSHV